MKRTINELIDELNKAFAEYHAACPMYEDNGNLVVEVDWHDWKHGHRFVDDLVQEKANYLGMTILMANAIVTEGSWNGYYSATHTYRFVA